MLVIATYPSMPCPLYIEVKQNVLVVLLQIVMQSILVVLLH